MNKKIIIIFVLGLMIGISVSLLFLKGKLGMGSLRTEQGVQSTEKTENLPSSVVHSSSSFNKESGLFSNFEGKDAVSWGGVKAEIVEGSICDNFGEKNGEQRAENGEKQKQKQDPSFIIHSSSSLKNKCLKATYPKGDYPGLSAKHLPKDWTGFDTLVLEVFNPNDDVVKFGILMKDKPGGHGYHNRYDGEFAFRPGKNKFVFNVTGLKTNDGKRQIDISQVIEFVIFLVKPKEPTVLYVDNIRLERAIGADIEGMQRFDFGPSNSEVWPGFIQVTDKTKYRDDLGYGWHETWGLKAEDRRYPDALFRDWVRGKGPFKVDVENGDYVVYMMLEDPGFWEYYQNYPERKIIAEGKVVGHEKMPSEKFLEEYYFAHMDHEDVPGADVFEDYVQKRFVWRRFEINVSDRQMSLKFDPGHGYANTLSALITAPLSKDKLVQEYMKRLDGQRREFFEGLYIEKVPQFKPIAVEVKNFFKDNGFVLFHHSPQEPMFPNSVPRQDQLLETISLMAYPGDIEPFVLGVYPFNDLGEVEPIVTDLIGSGGLIISKEDIRIRTVQYQLKLVGAKVYTVKGEMLRNNKRVNISQGTTRFFWLDVRVPEDTPAGVYRGVVTVTRDKGGRSQAANIVLNVLPFVPDEMDIPVGMFYGIPFQYNWYPELKSQRWTATERQLKDMRDHGMNTLALMLAPGVKNIYENGDVELDFKFFDEFLHAYKYFGFNQPVAGYGLRKVFHAIRDKTEGNKDLFEKAMVSAFKQINAHTKGLAGVEMVAGLADEISNTAGEGIDSFIDAAKILTQAGINTSGYFNSKKDRKVFPYIKTAILNNGMDISDSLFRYADKTDTDIWFYNIGQDRFSFGFYLWRTKAKGRLQWHYQLPAVDPYFDLDGRESDYCASYPSPAGPINTVGFELAREGIDDYRYMITLENLIEKRRAKSEERNGEEFRRSPLDSRHSVIKQAERLIEAFKKDIKVELKENKWIPSEYDARRRDAARMILELIENENGGSKMDNGNGLAKQ